MRIGASGHEADRVLKRLLRVLREALVLTIVR